MRITLSPKEKFGFMSLFLILFLWLIHLYGLSVYQYITEVNLHIVFRVILGGVIFSLWLTFFTYARIYDPILPGPWTRKETSYWSPLIVEISLSGISKLLLLIVKILIFSLLLYIVSSSIFLSLVEINNEIANGTYHYNRHREYYPLGLFFFILLLAIFSIIKILEKFGILKKFEKPRSNSSEPTKIK